MKQKKIVIILLIALLLVTVFMLLFKPISKSTNIDSNGNTKSNSNTSNKKTNTINKSNVNSNENIKNNNSNNQNNVNNSNVSNEKGKIIINCDKNKISVNEEVNCTLKGSLDDNITSVSGQLVSSQNIEIKNIKGSSNWQGNLSIPTIQYYCAIREPGDFDIATFTIKAVSKGSGTLKFTSIKNNNGSQVKVNIGDSNYNSVYVQEPSYNIDIE